MVSMPTKSPYVGARIEGEVLDSNDLASKGLLTFAQLSDRFESDPMRKAAIEAARRSMAHMLGTGLNRPFATLRLSVGLSQAGLAELVGTDESTISRLEAGLVKDIDPDLMKKLCGALNVSADVVEGAL